VVVIEGPHGGAQADDTVGGVSGYRECLGRLALVLQLIDRQLGDHAHCGHDVGGLSDSQRDGLNGASSVPVIGVGLPDGLCEGRDVFWRQVVSTTVRSVPAGLDLGWCPDSPEGRERRPAGV
jgi:hypothetical protein